MVGDDGGGIDLAGRDVGARALPGLEEAPAHDAEDRQALHDNVGGDVERCRVVADAQKAEPATGSNDLGGGDDGRGRTAHLEGAVDVTDGGASNRVGQRALTNANQRVRTHAFGKFEAVVIAVDGNDVARALCSGNRDSGTTDGSGSEHDHTGVTQAAVRAGMNCVAERFERRGTRRRQVVGHRPEIAGGQADVGRESTVDVDAEDARVGADMEVAAPTFGAVVTDDVGLDSEAFADKARIVDAVPDGNDGTADLVTHHPRRSHPRLRPRVPVVEMNVGPAHRSGGNLEKNLTGPGYGFGDITEVEPRGGGGLDDRLHSGSIMGVAGSRPNPRRPKRGELRHAHPMSADIPVPTSPGPTGDRRRRQTDAQHPTGPEHHRNIQGGAIRAGVFGVSDGLLTNVALVIGVAGAHPAAGFVRLAGVMGLIGGAFSMASGEFLSMSAQSELLEHELEIERRAHRASPEGETRELAAIYRKRGLTADEATTLASRIMEDPEVALEVHAREELGVAPGATGSPRAAALSSFITFAIGGLVPLIPWFFATGTAATVASMVVAALAAFGLGWTLAVFTGRGRWRSAIRQLAIAAAVAALTYGLGAAVGNQLAL